MERREASKMVMASESPLFVRMLWSFMLSGEGYYVMVGACPQKVCLPLTRGREPAFGLLSQKRGLEQVKGEAPWRRARRQGQGREEEEEGGWQRGEQEEGQGEVAPMASEVATRCSCFWRIQDCHRNSV